MHRPARPFAQPSDRHPCRRRGGGARVQLNRLIPGGDDTFTCCAATDTALEEVERPNRRCSVAKLWRGGDVARRLVEAVFAFADGFGPASVYWLTQEYKGPARSLYDTIAHRTSFVVERR
jgi:GNAT superfamily N-acetyltransferase